ncbi:2Fe-2S iron-sulfur cluster-binding protein [Paenibacillus sp. sgz500958]|uniref:2Fe-2S iron-sulfur cluster-binding protein n=1 Tax=Paenibacillus sp. sgz500958 TaxID=3242475 RepID=UPI0036D374C5
MRTHKGVTAVFLPDGRSATVPSGVTVLEAARRAGLTISTRCGGKAGCLMCKVTVEITEEQSVRPPGEVERRKLGSLLQKGVRLACQTAILNDVTVIVPEDPLKAAVRRRLEAARRGGEEELW